MMFSLNAVIVEKFTAIFWASYSVNKFLQMMMNIAAFVSWDKEFMT